MDKHSAELFRQYQLDFEDKCSHVRRKAGACTGRAGLGTDLEADLRATEALLKSMTMEARSTPGPQAKPLLDQVAQCTVQLQDLRLQVKAAASGAAGSVAAERAQLGLDNGATTAVQRAKMLSATQRLEQSSRSLAEAKAALAQAEASGAATLAELQRQRQVIEHSQKTLDEANGGLDSASGTLKTMLRRTRWFW